MMFSDLLTRRILVVEDDYLQASDMSYALELQGCDVVGPFPNLQEGIDAAAGSEIDAAVLDVRLGNERVYSLADLLHARKVPFLFVTGYDRTEIPDRFSAVQCLQKPFEVDAMNVVLAIALAQGKKFLN
jgi:DNA-binding NtrC family response regulator